MNQLYQPVSRSQSEFRFPTLPALPMTAIACLLSCLFSRFGNAGARYRTPVSPARSATSFTLPRSPDSADSLGPKNAPPPRGAGPAWDKTRFSGGASRSPMIRLVHSLVTLISILFSPGLRAEVTFNPIRRRPHHSHRFTVHADLGNISNFIQSQEKPADPGGTMLRALARPLL